MAAITAMACHVHNTGIMKTLRHVSLIVVVVVLVSGQALADPNRVLTSQASMKKVPAMAKQFRADAVIFDLDDTLVRPKTMLGSQRWIAGVYARLMKKHRGNEPKAFDAAVKVWDKVNSATTMKAVERSTPAAVRKLKRNHRVIALTARDDKLIGPTLKGLQNLGMSLGKGTGRVNLGRGAYFQDGVIFAGSPQNKLYALNAYQQRFGKIKRAMFVDDSGKNVKALVKGLKVPIHGVHYTGAEKAKRSYNEKIARVQLRTLKRTGRIPSNTRVRMTLGARKVKRTARKILRKIGPRK